jgi:hypothetical protein
MHGMHQSRRGAARRGAARHGRISHEEWALCKRVHQRQCPLLELFFGNSLVTTSKASLVTALFGCGTIATPRLRTRLRRQVCALDWTAFECDPKMVFVSAMSQLIRRQTASENEKWMQLAEDRVQWRRRGSQSVHEPVGESAVQSVSH